jgi:alkylation response protein AidB-like acyl-CoA dehydrogenase
MDLTPSPEAQSFRAQLRSWLEVNLPLPFDGDPAGDDVRYFEYLKAWQRKLAEGGWLGLTWPQDCGGRGLTAMEQAIFQEELALADAPPIVGLIGIGIIGPTITILGSDEHKRRYLPKMLLGDEIWAAGFSEPNAGSDLGSMSTRAVVDGDHFVVNGQKIWTTHAQFADWIFLMVRTDPDAPKFGGISCLLVDMKSEGISIRPLRQLTGESEFNEVFFNDVHVPAENLFGGLNGGWQVLMAALMYERTNLGGDMHVWMSRFLDRVVQAARDRGLAGDPLIRQRIAQDRVELEVLKAISTRAMCRVASGQLPGPESAVLKLLWSQLDQQVALTTSEILGPRVQLTEGDAAPFSYHYLRVRGRTIEAGTSEIMRNTIATRVLGLPKSF